MNRFSSVQDSISALGKALMLPTLSLRSFPNFVFGSKALLLLQGCDEGNRLND